MTTKQLLTEIAPRVRLARNAARMASEAWPYSQLAATIAGELDAIACVLDHAENSRYQNCPTCAAEGQVAFRVDIDEELPGTCPACHGDGFVEVEK